MREVQNLELKVRLSSKLRTGNASSYDGNLLSSMVRSFVVLKGVQNLSLEAILIGDHISG